MAWNDDTQNAVFSYRLYSPVELAAVGMIFMWLVIFYAAGRILFSHREN